MDEISDISYRLLDLDTYEFTIPLEKKMKELEKQKAKTNSTIQKLTDGIIINDIEKDIKHLESSISIIDDEYKKIEIQKKAIESFNYNNFIKQLKEQLRHAKYGYKIDMTYGVNPIFDEYTDDYYLTSWQKDNDMLVQFIVKMINKKIPNSEIKKCIEMKYEYDRYGYQQKKWYSYLYIETDATPKPYFNDHNNNGYVYSDNIYDQCVKII